MARKCGRSLDHHSPPSDGPEKCKSCFKKVTFSDPPSSSTLCFKFNQIFLSMLQVLDCTLQKPSISKLNESDKIKEQLYPRLDFRIGIRFAKKKSFGQRWSKQLLIDRTRPRLQGMYLPFGIFVLRTNFFRLYIMQDSLTSVRSSLLVLLTNTHTTQCKYFHMSDLTHVPRCKS